jgi:hypothetical protein
MAKITDPTYLNSLNVKYDTTAKTIELIAISGLTAEDGVTLQCVYSYTKEQWKLDNNLIKYPFPYVAITAEQFEIQDGWNWCTGNTINYIRDGGWALKSTGGTTLEEYMNLTTLGTFASTGDTAYYQQVNDGIGTETVYSGPVNQAIKIYGDTYNGNFDYRGFFKVYLREYQKIYNFYDLIESQNLTTLTYKKYAIPLSNAADTKITHTDTIVSGSTPYTNMSITWLDTPSGITIGSGTYNFSIIIDASGGTAEQVYEFVQYQLRKQGDIDAGTRIISGYTAEELLEFVGDNLKTLCTSGDTEGVYIKNFVAADTNRLTFTDDTNTPRTYPYVAAGTILFNDNLINDTNASYWVFYTDGYDTSGATLIQDNNDTDIKGSVGGYSSIAFTFDYDNNIQMGRTPGTNAPYTAVAIGLGTGQYVKTSGTITRSTSNVINFVAALERNYSNPV